MSERTNSGRLNTKKITAIAMLCALAFIAKLISNVIPIKVSGFLEFDLKDVILVMAGFIYGPLSAAACAVIVSLIEMLSISESGIIGFVMNSISSCAFACTAAFIYKRRRSMRGAELSLICGVLFMTAIMLLWNYLITPLYMHVDRSVVTGMLLTVFLPFNLIKGGMNAVLSLLLYKPLVTALNRAHLIPDSPTSRKGSTNRTLIWVSLVLLLIFVLGALKLAGVF